MEKTAYAIYKGLTAVAEPLVSLLLTRRLKKGKEDGPRLPERRGRPAFPRPVGQLIWVHGASVGESLSLLSLIDRIAAEHPAASVLVTTGTVTSARLMAQRLPVRAIHQFMPVDVLSYVRRFLDHWRPDAVLWAESDLWPNMLAEVKRRNIPAVLVNARMSQRSFARWQKMPGLSRFLLGGFNLCLAQNEDEAGRYRALGVSRVEAPGNLKYAAMPLPVIDEDLAACRAAIAGRPAWLFASTHPGEEEMAGRVHAWLATRHPGLLTVIVPRHPARGGDIARGLADMGLSVEVRGAGKALPQPTDAIYVADTLGELGLFYRLNLPCVIGGSFVPHGGHNPIEPGQLGAAIFLGPHMHNFDTIVRDFAQAGAALSLDGEAALREVLDRALSRPDDFKDMAARARQLTQSRMDIVETVFRLLAPVLKGTA